MRSGGFTGQRMRLSLVLRNSVGSTCCPAAGFGANPFFHGQFPATGGQFGSMGRLPSPSRLDQV